MDCKNRKGTLLLLSYTRIEGGGGEEGSFYSGAVGGWTTHIKMTLRIDTYHHNESRHTAVAQKQVKTRASCCQLLAAKKLLMTAQRGLIFDISPAI